MLIEDAAPAELGALEEQHVITITPLDGASGIQVELVLV